MRRKYFVRYNTDGSTITNCSNPNYEVSEDGKTITNLKVDNIDSTITQKADNEVITNNISRIDPRTTENILEPLVTVEDSEPVVKDGDNESIYTYDYYDVASDSSGALVTEPYCNKHGHQNEPPPPPPPPPEYLGWKRFGNRHFTYEQQTHWSSPYKMSTVDLDGNVIFVTHTMSQGLCLHRFNITTKKFEVYDTNYTWNDSEDAIPLAPFGHAKGVTSFEDDCVFSSGSNFDAFLVMDVSYAGATLYDMHHPIVRAKFVDGQPPKLWYNNTGISGTYEEGKYSIFNYDFYRIPTSRDDVGNGYAVTSFYGVGDVVEPSDFCGMYRHTLATDYWERLETTGWEEFKNAEHDNVAVSPVPNPDFDRDGDHNEYVQTFDYFVDKNGDKKYLMTFIREYKGGYHLVHVHSALFDAVAETWKWWGNSGWTTGGSFNYADLFDSSDIYSSSALYYRKTLIRDNKVCYMYFYTEDGAINKAIYFEYDIQTETFSTPSVVYNVYSPYPCRVSCKAYNNKFYIVYSLPNNTDTQAPIYFMKENSNNVWSEPEIVATNYALTCCDLSITNGTPIIFALTAADVTQTDDQYRIDIYYSNKYAATFDNYNTLDISYKSHLTYETYPTDKFEMDATWVSGLQNSTYYTILRTSIGASEYFYFYKNSSDLHDVFCSITGAYGIWHILQQSWTTGTASLTRSGYYAQGKVVQDSKRLYAARNLLYSRCHASNGAAMYFQPVNAEYTYGAASVFATGLGYVAGVAITTDKLYIVDNLNNNILVYDTSPAKADPPTLSSTISLTFGSGDGQFKFPTDIVVMADGRLLVVDLGNHRVQILNTNGSYYAKFGTLGRGNGQLYYPKYATVDDDGNFYVSEMNNRRISVFNSSYVFQYSMSSFPVNNADFDNPVSINDVKFVDGSLYIVFNAFSKSSLVVGQGGMVKLNKVY